MQHVALAAALFAGALIAPVGSSASASLTSSGAPHLNNIINKSTVLSVDRSEGPSLATIKDSRKDGEYAKNRPAVSTASATKEKPTEVKTIAVASGDNLSKLAEQNGTNYQRLYYANTEINDPDLIFPGQQLRVPAADAELTPRALPENAPAAVKAEVQAEAAAPAYSTPAPRATVAAPSVAGGSVWDRLAQCEAGGNWSINTGNGFYGGLQFTQSSWAAVGGSGMPNEASREEQIMRGERLQALQGWGAWPACTAKLGIY